MDSLATRMAATAGPSQVARTSPGCGDASKDAATDESSVARTIASWIAAPSRAKPEVITTALRIETLLDEGHPTEPYWYLQILGVDPTRQGRGIGSRMLREALAMADRDDVASVLETSKPANLRLYERYGFRITRTTRLDSSPPIWTMQRARGGHP